METVGRTSIEGISHRWMAPAKDARDPSGMSLDRLAAEIGYEAANTFSLAFRRYAGRISGGFAYMHRPSSCERPGTAQDASSPFGTDGVRFVGMWP